MASTLRFKLPLDEFRVWAQQIRPLVDAAGPEPAGTANIEYVTTELLNNVVDHSEGTYATISIQSTPDEVSLVIVDDGIGLFRKLQRDLGLTDLGDAPLQLIKGKTTTDPKAHTGEGIFFCARVADWLSIMANGLDVTFGHDHATTLEFVNHPTGMRGTTVRCKLAKRPARTLKEVFAEFCPEPDLRFSRTIISMRLVRDLQGSLVSRSQAKRVVAGLEKFTEVVFDFAGVERVEQGFADEVFRVWREAQPSIRVSVVNASADVTAMLKHAGFTNP